MAIKEGKKRVAITLAKEDYKRLKKKAIDAEMTLSEYLVSACDYVEDS